LVRQVRAALAVPVVLALGLVPTLREAGADGGEGPIYPLSAE
jgi:hypothetical protein